MKQAQSYYSVLLKGKMSIYEMRILLKIVQSTRLITAHRGKYSEQMQKQYSADGINLNFSIPISELIGAKSHNYAPIKSAARRLEHDWQVEYYEKDKRIWRLTSMIYNVSLEERTGMLNFSCARWLIDYITDFKNGGYREYVFELAMSLRNAYATRLYLLTASQTTPLRYSLNMLKEILGVDKKYTRTHDFIRRVIEPAAAELKQKGINGFDYEIIRRHADKPHSEAVGIKLIPIKREKNDVNISSQIKETKENVPAILLQYLVQQWQFSNREIVSNRSTLAAYTKLAGWQNKFVEISDRARRKNKGHGYLIAAMKAVIKEQAGSRLPAPHD